MVFLEWVESWNEFQWSENPRRKIKNNRDESYAVESILSFNTIVRNLLLHIFNAMHLAIKVRNNHRSQFLSFDELVDNRWTVNRLLCFRLFKGIYLYFCWTWKWEKFMDANIAPMCACRDIIHSTYNYKNKNLNFHTNSDTCHFKNNSTHMLQVLRCKQKYYNEQKLKPPYYEKKNMAWQMCLRLTLSDCG